MKRLLSSTLFVLATSTFACSVNLDPQTPGQTGRLSFQLKSGSCLVFGCALDRSVLAGAKMDLRVSGLDPITAYTLRSSSPAITIAGRPERSCSCASGALERPEDPCPPGETKTCELTATLDSAGPGDARVDVVDDKGAIVDAATVYFVPADRVESRVRLAGKDVVPGADGAYELPAGASFGIDSAAFLGDTQLEIGERGFRIDYSDPRIVAADSPGLFDGPTREPARAGASGEATVRVAASGASRQIRVRVVP